MSRERVHELARGRVWTGADAHERGLVDELGGLRPGGRAGPGTGPACRRTRQLRRWPHDQPAGPAVAAALQRGPYGREAIDWWSGWGPLAGTAARLGPGARDGPLTDAAAHARLTGPDPAGHGPAAGAPAAARGRAVGGAGRAASPAGQNAPVPFGVPSPVGPSQPARAVHSWDGEQVPLLTRS